MSDALWRWLDREPIGDPTLDALADLLGYRLIPDPSPRRKYMTRNQATKLLANTEAIAQVMFVPKTLGSMEELLEAIPANSECSLYASGPQSWSITIHGESATVKIDAEWGSPLELGAALYDWAEQADVSWRHQPKFSELLSTDDPRHPEYVAPAAEEEVVPDGS